MVSLLESTGDLGLVGLDQWMESRCSFLFGLCRSKEPAFFIEDFRFGGSGALGGSKICSNESSGLTARGMATGVTPGTPGAGGGGGGGGGGGTGGTAAGTWGW